MHTMFPKTESASNFGDFFRKARLFLFISIIVIKIKPAIVITIPTERIIQKHL